MNYYSAPKVKTIININMRPGLNSKPESNLITPFEVHILARVKHLSDLKRATANNH
jgi:hypothetical protein